jgi:hypothetical protein
MQETDLVRAVEELQETVAALERRTNDLALKVQITSSQVVGRVGLDRFFAEPEFWENVIDVGQAECSQRCIKELQAAYAAIAANTTYSDAERQAAYQQALDNAALCHQRCAEAFPTPIG